MDAPPAKLYKYFAPQRSSIFDDWLIRFTQPVALNDPFEMRPHIAGYGTPEEEFAAAADRWEEHVELKYDELVNQYGRRISYAEFRARIEKDREPMIRRAVAESQKNNAEMASRIDEMLNASVGVLSLCAHPDSLLMWPHYGDSYRGFVVEFDTSSPFFKQEQPPEHAVASEEGAAQFAEEYGRLRVVRYRDERPSVVVTKLTFDLLLTKGRPWKYEDEWRMLMPLMYAEKIIEPDKLGHPVHLFKIPPSAVTKIILGHAADEKLVAHTLTLRSRLETQHVAIEKVRIDERHFRLHFDPVE